jgi:hypothetical protein
MKIRKLTHASFSISSDQVVPEFWTSYFGIKPDVAIVKNEPFTASAGKLVAYRHEPVHGTYIENPQSIVVYSNHTFAI